MLDRLFCSSVIIIIRIWAWLSAVYPCSSRRWGLPLGRFFRSRHKLDFEAQYIYFASLLVERMWRPQNWGEEGVKLKCRPDITSANMAKVLEDILPISMKLSRLKYLDIYMPAPLIYFIWSTLGFVWHWVGWFYADEAGPKETDT